MPRVSGSQGARRGEWAGLVGIAAVGKTSAVYRSTHSSAFIIIFSPPCPVSSSLLDCYFLESMVPGH